MYMYVLGWPKSLFRFFCKMLWKNLNELFGQPNIIVCISPCTMCFPGPQKCNQSFLQISEPLPCLLGPAACPISMYNVFSGSSEMQSVISPDLWAPPTPPWTPCLPHPQAALLSWAGQWRLECCGPQGDPCAQQRPGGRRALRAEAVPPLLQVNVSFPSHFSPPPDGEFSNLIILFARLL